MTKSFAYAAVMFAGLLAVSSAAFALPADPAGPGASQSVLAASEDARVFCFNRASGRFLHWGSCYRSAPRVYCRNRWSGRFLHWGAC